MKFKKSISAALAAATLMSSVSVVSYAAVDEAMKTALTYVKERIEIPEELEKFNYDTSTSYDDKKYNFRWETEDGYDKYSSLRVSICGKVITSYSYSPYRENYESDYSFGKLSQEEILEKAEEWVKTLNPTVYSSIEIVKDSLNVSISGERARVNIRRVKNGIPVNGQTGSVVINKNTGELISFSLNWVRGATFAKSSKAISKEEAIEGFMDEIPVELMYVTEYDYETEMYIPHLIYHQTVFGQIDALTGKLSTFEESYFAYDDFDDMVEVEEEEEAVADSGVNFTKGELEKMEKEGSLITAKDALDELDEMGIFCLGENPEVQNEYCYYDDTYDSYLRNFTFTSDDKNYYPIEDEEIPYDEPEEEVMEDYDTDEDVAVEEYIADDDGFIRGNATINAETGELLSFNIWDGGNSLSGKVTAKNASRTLNKYIEQIAGEKAEEFTLDTPSFSYSEYNKKGEPTKNAKIVSAYAYSPRYAYDIPCNTENISIGINGDKKITSYDIRYYGIEYPAPEDIITGDSVYESYFEQVNFNLQYRLAAKEKKILSAMVYCTDKNLYIDAFTGKLTRGNGAEYVESYTGGYTDLEGSKYRKVAEKLAMYNITLMDEGGKLNADEYITRQEFSNLVSNIGCWYYNRTGADTVLTRQFAAKILTNNIISEACAEIPGIFKSPFSDVKDSSKYVGYIAVANGLGLMSGKNGKFKPNTKVTRGEALQMVYDYLAD